MKTTEANKRIIHVADTLMREYRKNKKAEKREFVRVGEVVFYDASDHSVSVIYYTIRYLNVELTVTQLGLELKTQPQVSMQNFNIIKWLTKALAEIGAINDNTDEGHKS